MNTTPRIIKKYANRRLYDTESSNYITLDDLKKLVLDRVEFRVLDAKTNADITKTTLLQIISAHEETITPIFTIEVLQHLIRSYGDNMQNMLGQYLEQAMEFFIHQQEIYKVKQQEYSANSFGWMNELFNFQQKLWNSFHATHSSTDEATKPKSTKKNHQKSEKI